MLPLTGSFCSSCGERLTHAEQISNDGKMTCSVCRQDVPPFARGIAYGSYEGALRELVHLLKYEGVRPAAKVLGIMLAQAVDPMLDGFEGDVLVVPVPLYSRKLRERGFNQAALIAEYALKCLSSGRFELDARVLKRQRLTESQIGLTQHQRKENLRGAFKVVKPEAFSGREVLLVDDVYTTGTTVSECARVLKRAGAKNVYVATVARTMKLSRQEPGRMEAVPLQQMSYTA
jgi:ComF family protein